ncbi:MAG: hypothetical protein ACLP59_05060 [Bryobacteraceae bacterium]
MQDQAFMDAINAFEKLKAAGGLSAEAIDLCGIYKKVKPILSGILPFIKLIPVWGATAAAAIQALMDFLDGVCK